MPICKQCGQKFEYGTLELKIRGYVDSEYGKYCSDFCLATKLHEEGAWDEMD